MAFAQEEDRLSPFRKLLLDFSSELSSHDLEKLKFASIDLIPRGMIESVSSGLKLFDVLEQDGRITPQNLSLLMDMLKAIGRMDLAWKVEHFLTSLVNDDPDKTTFGVKCNGDTVDDEIEVQDGADKNNDSIEKKTAVPGKRKANVLKDENDNTEIDDVVTDGVGDEPERNGTASALKRPRGVAMDRPLDETQVPHVGEASCYSSFFSAPDTRSVNSARYGGQEAYVTARATPTLPGTDNASSSFGVRGPAPIPVHAAAPVPAVAACSQAQPGQHSRLQHDSSVTPAPVRYVNYLAYEGYSVEIIGGKHFKTPDGEFVEIKSGTQYKIHVKNSRAYGCNLDISIDGYDIGGWVVDGGQEVSIERPAYEAKRLTFYRVKTAPKEAGIEPGRSENGVVKCVFTPEAFQEVTVIIPGFLEPLKVDIAPSATVGDLKYEVQSQLNISPDPDQILALNDKVMSNSTRLSHVRKSNGNLRLIDSELEITVEASTKEIFPVKIRPGKAKVIDVMEQIERKLGVFIRDQKLYHGKARLSKAPQRGLPEELICSLQPTVVVIVPEFILITVEDSVSGNSSIVKIDKEKTLSDLMDEIPSCRNLQENEEAIFYVNGKKLYPSKDEGSLTNLGISSGSKMEVKVEITFIDIYVRRLPGILPTNSFLFRCGPQETFRDLLNKVVEASPYTAKLDGATFSTQERIFDPNKDIGPLQDYGIQHCSTLVLKLAELQSNEDSLLSHEAQSLQPENNDKINLNETIPPGLGIAAVRVWTPPRAGNQLDEMMRLYASSYGQPQHQMLRPTTTLASSYDLSQIHLDPRSTGRVLTENDPAWKAGGTTLQGYSTQQFIPADPIKVDPSKKIELVLRLVAREDETNLVFPEAADFQPLSTLHPPPVPE